MINRSAPSEPVEIDFQSQSAIAEGRETQNGSNTGPEKPCRRDGEWIDSFDPDWPCILRCKLEIIIKEAGSSRAQPRCRAQAKKPAADRGPLRNRARPTRGGFGNIGDAVAVEATETRVQVEQLEVPRAP